MLCFEEIRRCYLDSSDMAVVLLCLAYVEREVAAQLYAAGWNRAKKAPLVKVLERAYEDGVLSELEWRTYAELAHLRNSYAHFHAPGFDNPTWEPELPRRKAPFPSKDQAGFRARVVKENALGTELLAKDARGALEAMARIVNRQSGQHVALSPPNE